MTGNLKILKKLALFAAVLVFVIAISPGHSQSQCLTSVDGTSSITNATTGTNVVISVSTTGTDCTVSSLVLESDPNTLTIVDPPSGQHTSFSAGATKTFTITAGTEGVYTITARGTTSAGSVSDNTPVIIEFVDPSTLTIEGSPATTTVRYLESATISVNIRNNQDSDITTSYAFHEGVDVEYVSGDPETGTVTVAANSASSRSWTVKHNDCTTALETVEVDIGDSTNVFVSKITTNVTCGDPPSNASSTPSASPGASGDTTTDTATTTTTTTQTNATTTGETAKEVTAITTERRATAVIDEIPAETSAEVIVEKSEEIGVRRITISAKNTVRNVEVSITKLDGRPSGTPVLGGKIFSYIEINATNLNQSDIGNVLVDFDVDRTWVNESNIDENTIALLRYTDKWTSLKTTKTGETDTKLLFQAESPGFSVFAVAGYEKLDTLIFVYAGIVAVIIVVAFLVIRKMPRRRDFRPKKSRKKPKPKDTEKEEKDDKLKYKPPKIKPTF